MAGVEPRTEAGRALLADVPNYMDGRSYRDRVMLPAILAIEREAAAPDAPAPLDREPWEMLQRVATTTRDIGPKSAAPAPQALDVLDWLIGFDWLIQHENHTLHFGRDHGGGAHLRCVSPDGGYLTIAIPDRSPPPSEEER